VKIKEKLSVRLECNNMTEKKWYETFEGCKKEYNGKFNNDMALEYKYGRDLYDGNYRREHGMIQRTNYDLDRMMQDCGIEE
jgi:hypothetical protein